MFKKVLTLALAIVCLASFAIVGVSALEPDVDGEIVYFVDLVTPEMIEDIQGYITYDADVFEVVDCDTTNLGESAIVNYEEAGSVYFNASVVKGIDFTGDTYKNVIEVKFNIIDDVDLNDIDALYELVEESISYTIEEMTEKDGDSYFTDSTQVNENVEVGYGFLSWAPDTEPSSTAVVTEPTSTAAATTATAAATTVVEPAETDATSTTDAPVNTDVPDTGASVAIFVALAVVAMAGVVVVVLRKKANA